MSFNIQIKFGGGLSAAQEGAFQAAAARWSQIITGDLPAVEVGGELIDDVAITAEGVTIDGAGRILGQAGPAFVRSDSMLPVTGMMQFDSADLDAMEADGSLVDVIIHEMGHVLGIGTLWEAKGLLVGAGTSDPRFIGPKAQQVYAKLLGESTPRPVPVANRGGPGTADGHWREDTFRNELMTGFLNAGINPLSLLTIASLEDMGYEVDRSAADAFSLPTGPIPEAAVSRRYCRTLTPRWIPIPVEPSDATGIEAFGINPASAVDQSRFSPDAIASESFSWPAALSLALASDLAYSPPGVVVNTALNVWKLDACEFLSAGETQCFIGSTADVLLVAFRGTESLGDWLGNLDVFSTQKSYGRVHRGFWSAFQDVRELLDEAFAQWISRPVVITGHSLGGALATIAAAEWQGVREISGIYTFGQPRVGKADFADFAASHFGNRFYRFVNDDDIVPRVPPGYEHVGRLFQFDGVGNVESAIEAVQPEKPALTPQQFAQLQNQLRAAEARQLSPVQPSLNEAATVEGFFPSFRDHHLERYIAKISRHLA